MAISEIEWTEETINPTMGCSLVSPGCEHCYAMRQAYRLEQMGVKGYEGTTKKLASGKIVWTGKINFDISKLERAVRTKTPTTFFVDSMSDLFHEKVTFSFIAVAYEIMMNAKQHSFQILTKRIDRALEFYNIAKSYDTGKRISTVHYRISQNDVLGITDWVTDKSKKWKKPLINGIELEMALGKRSMENYIFEELI